MRLMPPSHFTAIQLPLTAAKHPIQERKNAYVSNLPNGKDGLAVLAQVEMTLLSTAKKYPSKN